LLEEFFKSNVDKRLSERRKTVDKAEKKIVKKIIRAGEKELRYEMNHYEWTTEELPDGREKVIILRDKNENKD
jgi:hypothetical protein